MTRRPAVTDRSSGVVAGPWAPLPPPPKPLEVVAVELAALCLCDSVEAKHLGSHYHTLGGVPVCASSTGVDVIPDGHLGIRGTDIELTLRPPWPLFTTDHYEMRRNQRKLVPIVRARKEWRPYEDTAAGTLSGPRSMAS